MIVCMKINVLLLQSWQWMIGPFVIYIIERIVRFTRSLFYPVIVKVVEHPSKVMEIQFRKKGFHAEVGQYVFLNCPKVALFEWHPMTLTSVSVLHLMLTWYI